MHPKNLSITNYTYSLPESRIAKYPLAERDQSKLLVYRGGHMTESTYAQLAGQLPAGSLLIFNNTKVVEARLLFQKVTGGTIEIFCLEPHEQYPDITTAMLQKRKVWWKCLVGGAKKWKEEILKKQLSTQTGTLELSAQKIKQCSDYYVIELQWGDATLTFAEVLHHAGLVPLPPYLNRAAEITDKERYQTIYARHDGSVAAPTAGLHFTDRLFDTLKAKNIQHDFVTLHVGAGTFKPVKAATMHEHEMHAEFIDVHQSLIEKILQQLPNTIITVGTTSLRTVESLYWLGVKIKLHPHLTPASLHLTQWEPYELAEKNIPAADALQSLLQWMKTHNTTRLLTKTQIIIAPGYSFRLINALITNFHQPQSTLLLIVAAITGDDWRKMYDYALVHEFRFLSYGDGCLLFLPSL